MNNLVLCLCIISSVSEEAVVYNSWMIFSRYHRISIKVGHDLLGSPIGLHTTVTLVFHFLFLLLPNPHPANGSSCGGTRVGATGCIPFHTHLAIAMARSEPKSGLRVSTRAESTGVADQLELNPGHFATLPGALKMAQLVLGCVCVGCASPQVTGSARFLVGSAATSLALALVFCLVHLFGLRRVWTGLPWIRAELWCAVLFGLLLLASSLALLAASSEPGTRLALIHHGYYTPYVVAGCFGLLDCFACSAAAFFLLMEWRASAPTLS
ncbi:hypothetical protein JTE90_007372 [Oedothorax gibbosus]|uniref:MARVEL domain-containing protein n=1 Tax=Oedothorax gibbosus TaxID=931172 RepID=A0AAV6U719_9ARAC|nr:hypothetical protein JTE90_007372 [Oedothorax gibbosus]